MSIKIGDKVTLGTEGGPPLIVWKIIEQEAVCRWYDAFGEMHQKEYPLHRLRKADDERG